MSGRLSVGGWDAQAGGAGLRCAVTPAPLRYRGKGNDKGCGLADFFFFLSCTGNLNENNRLRSISYQHRVCHEN